MRRTCSELSKKYSWPPFFAVWYVLEIQKQAAVKLNTILAMFINRWRLFRLKFVTKKSEA